MNVVMEHSIEQDMTVIKFLNLKDYFRALKYLDHNKMEWTPLKFSSRNDTASIRVSEKVLNRFSNTFGVGKTCQY